MRTPRGGVQQLDLLRHHQRAELGGEALGEALVLEHRGPVRAAIGVVVEFPEMDELVDHAGVALEVADQVLRMTAFFEGRKAELLIELHRLGHLADIERVGAKFVECHRRSPSAKVCGPTEGEKTMSVKRINAGPRMSSAVVHGGTVYLAGLTADDAKADVKGQTKQILDKIDKFLKEAGTDKSNILSANIWLTDIGTWGQMNEVWDAWVSPGNSPARATVEAKLANPALKVEIMVQAAI